MTIVNINVSVKNPPKPATLLKSGAFVSVGGTTLAPGSVSLLTSDTDLADLLPGVINITAATWALGVATFTTASEHGWEVGEVYPVVIAGMAPTTYNGGYNATVVDANTFTVPISTEPTAATSFGTVKLNAVTELQQMNTSFWAQGKQRAVYVLELGPVNTVEAVQMLGAYVGEDLTLGNTYQKLFSYLVPRAFDSEPTFKTLCNLYTAPDAMVYFWITSTEDTREAWYDLGYKSALVLVQSPNAPTTEFSMAMFFQSALANDPSSANMVPPMAFRFMFGGTAFPVTLNGAKLKDFKANNINYIGTGAEGGLSNMILCNGHCLDGKPFNYWYSVAWAILNLQLNIANEIINGSNSTSNPLYYDQQGIDRLQKRALSTLGNGISYGLFIGRLINQKLNQDEFNVNYNDGDYNGQCVVNAIPFTNWTADNPSDYADGSYGGMSAVVTPRRGFESITFNLNVTNFVG